MKKIILILLLFFCAITSFAQISFFPYKENFDSITTPKLPLGWTTTTNKSAGGDFTTSTSSPRTGSLPNCVSATDARVNQILIPPQFNFIGKVVDSLELYERRTSTFTAGLLIEVSINNDTSFSIHLGDTLKLTASNNGAYQRRVFALPETLNNKSNVRFRWRVVGIPNGGATAVIRFDDIRITVKKRVDLAATSLTTVPQNPRSGETVTAAVGLKNAALAGNFSFDVQLFDSLTLVASTSIPSLNLTANESTTVQLQYANIGAGRHPFSAKIVLSGDEDTTNNTISKVVNVGFQPRTILINEIMYAPPPGMPEWVECVNNSSDSILFSGWRISDAGTTKAAISPTNRVIVPYSYFVITTDTATFKNFYTITAPLFQAPFSALNNTTADAVVLFDPTNTMIDSVLYSPSWGGTGGKSLERIDTAAASTLQNNWKTSLHPLGATPGTINSVSKKEFDVSVERISVSPQFPVVGNQLAVSSVIKNIGKQNLSMLNFTLYVDANKDSVFDANELQHQQSVGSLAANDSSVIIAQLAPLPQGTHWIFAVASAQQDDDSTNNRRLFVLTVGIPAQSIVINEIMYAPTGDMPEWVEFFNRSTSPISIAGWKISDNGSTKTTITNSTIPIQPQSYFIVTADSSFKNYYSVTVPVFIASFSALNNTTPDAVVLYDERGATIDSVYYRQSWGGTNGNSLQRFDIFSSSTDSANWRSALPSAGIENIVARKDFDVEVRRVTSANNTNGTRIVATIFNSGRQPAISLTVKIYHDSNRDSIAQVSELLSSSNISTITPLDSVTVTYDWNVTIQGKQQIIVSIGFLQDERAQNNIGFATVTNSFPAQSLVINEIMYEPESGNSEFVELYNRSGDSIDVAGWRLMDQPTYSGSRAMISLSEIPMIVPPNGYVIVASDSSIFTQFPSLVGRRVVISSSLSLNNSGEDIVLVDLTNTQIDSVRYSLLWHLKNIVTSGRSLERINPSLLTTDARNWSSSVSTGGATPGMQNSIFTSSSAAASALSLSPNPFSPDNDGFEDFLSIDYILPSNSSRIRVRIFDATGRLVRRLATDELAPANGFIIWNGLDDNGVKARIGMYIVLLEALDNFGGVVRTMKDVAVVAMKL